MIGTSQASQCGQAKRNPPRGRYVAPRLAGAVKTALERGEQALLFLNRRGYAPLTLCRACGFRFACPHCDAWLVDHRFKRQLVCHHCGFATPRPASCPKCQAADCSSPAAPASSGSRRRRRHCFPGARIMVLSSDLIATPERMREEFKEIEEGHVDVVIGTQLVAKGHHFPNLNLVGIIDADLGLANGDPRAAERTFQLLHQVGGRAGRYSGRGFVYLQTHQPDHPVMRALIACDREAFYASEIAAREKTIIRRSGGSRASSCRARTGRRPKVTRAACAGAALHDEQVRILGPAEAPIAVIRGRHRFRVLIKAPRGYDLSAYMRDWLRGAPKAATGVKLEVDIDPMSFL